MCNRTLARTAIGLFASGVLILAWPLPISGVTYMVENLGTLGGVSSEAHDINESGQVVGFSKTTAELKHAFLYQDGVMTDLGTLSGSESWGYGINESGQIAGEAMAFGERDYKRAFFWENGVMTDLGTLGGPYAFAWDINDLGQAVGSAAPDDYQGRAFLWQSGVMTNLGTLGGNASYAYGINNSAQVVGWARRPPSGEINEHAFLWEAGVMTDLGTLGGSRSQAWDINEASHVVGFSQTAGLQWHAFLWQDGGMTDLGTLGGSSSWAFGINEREHIVGWAHNAASSQRASLWHNGVITDLNDLTDPNLGWTLTDARSINNLGQIVGFGTIGGQQRAFLLTPVYSLTVTKVNGPYGQVMLAPEPNDPNAPAYRTGTVLTLTAVPNEGKSFRQWEIYDANHPGDSNYATIDANSSTTIEMDGDREVVAVFKCGSSGLPPFLLAAVLVVLIVRRGIQ